ncbi:MAG: NAD(P)/FAD-dependent oxidoreductase [Planctomycetes bacterium]|nr:NAD(P)/FAD-dependent oxidoreductase [Planctomycetota bacterium]
MPKQSHSNEALHRVVVIGGGFGGLRAARALRRAPVEVTLVDRRNFHLFQPLLYQVATGGLSPANIAAPLRSVLKRQKNVHVILGEATGFDVDGRRVLLADDELRYDSLIVATGVRHHYFGRDDWEAAAPGLKSVEEATEIRRRILLAFEAAERATDDDELRRLLTFVVVGAGPTGVELAGTLGELAHHTLRRDFRRIDTRQARVLLVEGVDRVLPPYPPDLSAKALKHLERLGVTVRTGARVVDIRPDAVEIAVGETTEMIPTRTVFWAAGVKASPLGRLLAEAAGASLDRAGRVIVEPDCSLPGHPAIYVVGDLAHFAHDGGEPLPGVAPVAIQQGDYVARRIGDRLHGAETPPFRYRDYGRMATIGRTAAVAEIGRWKMSGRLAWIAWLFVHLMYIVGFQNRVLVLLQWAGNYLTRNRSARLITAEHALSPDAPPQVRRDVSAAARDSV